MHHFSLDKNAVKVCLYTTCRSQQITGNAHRYNSKRRITLFCPQGFSGYLMDERNGRKSISPWAQLATCSRVKYLNVILGPGQNNAKSLKILVNSLKFIHANLTRVKTGGRGFFVVLPRYFHSIAKYAWTLVVIKMLHDAFSTNNSVWATKLLFQLPSVQAAYLMALSLYALLLLIN